MLLRRRLLLLLPFACGLALLVDGASAASLLLLAVSLGVAAVVLTGGPPRPEVEAPAPVETPAVERPPLDEAALASAIADPLLVLDGHRIVQANRAALSRFGHHLVRADVRVALRHPGLLDLLPADGASARPQATTITGLGGAGVWWEARTAPAPDGRVILHLVDRTAARAADRTRTDFVANASHELRTPLASILGFVEQLEGEAGAQAGLRAKFLGVIARESKRMQQLTEDLLSLSRIESERHAPPRAPVSLAALARSVAEEARGRGLEDGRTVTVEAVPDLPPVPGDEGQLRQLVTNLVDNALKYGRAGTPVTLGVHRAAALVELTVADEGEGIASEHLPRLTERFYRIDAGRSRRVGGTGLGLAIAKHVVERHRGTIRIQSVVGQGTTVTVRLPVWEEE